MGRRLFAARVLAGVGVLLLVVAVIHLAVTPLLKKSILDRVLTPTMMPTVAPPFLLNHIVVGILLLPLGFVTLYCSTGIRAGEWWAWVVSWAIAASLVCLPVVLVLVMRGGPFDALPFRVAEVLVTLCALAMPCALVWTGGEFHRRATRAP